MLSKGRLVQYFVSVYGVFFSSIFNDATCKAMALSYLQFVRAQVV